DVFGIDESRSAFEGLALLGGEKTKSFLLDTATRGPVASRPLAVAALAGIDLASAADKAADLLTAVSAKDNPGELFVAFLNRKGGAAALARALRGKKLNADVAKVGLQVVRSSVQDAKPLSDALTKAGGLAAAR